MLAKVESAQGESQNRSEEFRRLSWTPVGTYVPEQLNYRRINGKVDIAHEEGLLRGSIGALWRTKTAYLWWA